MMGLPICIRSRATAYLAMGYCKAIVKIMYILTDCLKTTKVVAHFKGRATQRGVMHLCSYDLNGVPQCMCLCYTHDLAQPWKMWIFLVRSLFSFKYCIAHGHVRSNHMKLIKHKYTM